MTKADITDPTVYPLAGIAELEEPKRSFANVCDIVALNTGGKQPLWVSLRAIKTIYSMQGPHADLLPQQVAKEVTDEIDKATDAGVLCQHKEYVTLATSSRLQKIVDAKTDADSPGDEFVSAAKSHLESCR